MKYIKFKKIIKCSKTLINKESLLKDWPLQIQLNGREYTCFSDGDFVILDFGKETSGGIRLFTDTISNNSSVRIRFGESVGEVCSDIGEKGATNDHSPRDFVVKVITLSDLTFGQTGFRFVRLDFSGESWHLRNAVASIDTDTRTEYGYFKSNDVLLNKIWKTASYTLRLNLHNGLFWDGVKRDRLCWIGDSYPEMKASLCLYKSVPEIHNSLQFTIDTTPDDGWMDFSPAYNLWAMLMLADNFKYDGDLEFINKNVSKIITYLNKFDNEINEDGSTHLPFYFIDWPSHYDGGDGDELIKQADEIVGVSYLMELTFARVKELGESINNLEIISLCDKLINKLSKKPLKVKKFKQIAALGVMSGHDDKNNESILMNNGANGLSTFQSYFILSAVSHYGHYKDALDMLKEYYGGMLKVGATTFWEDFELSWLDNASRIDKLPKKGQKDIHGDYGKFCYTGYRHSLCHGWSSGVIAYIVENIVGLKVIDSKTYKLEPRLDGLTNCECKFPTKYGPIIINNSVVDGKLVTEIIKKPVEIQILK